MERAMTRSHVSPSPAQSREPVAVDCKLTRSQASHVTAQCLKPGAVGKGALAKSEFNGTHFPDKGRGISKSKYPTN